MSLLELLNRIISERLLPGMWAIPEEWHHHKALLQNDPGRLHPWSSSKNLQTAQQAKRCLFHIVLTLIAYLTLRKEFVNLVNFRSFLVLVNFFSL